ncbi:MAG: hypothetical protein K6G88_10025 [Lachnospiraceae bacterium]|nr:hypothetical protein [Lachnospiraceae bacterium]
MNKKDKINKGLNEAFSDMAPDILDKILMSDIQPVESLESDLRDEPVFVEKSSKKHGWVPSMAMSVASACAVMVIAVLGILVIPLHNQAVNTVACSITFDVNPSISVGYNKKGDIISINANNKDAEKVVDHINNKIDKKMKNDKKIDMTLSEIKKNGYLKEKSSVVLVSADIDEKNSVSVINNVKSDISTYRKKSDSQFTVVYQEYKNDDKVNELAEKKCISKGKAAYCIKVSKKVKEKPAEIAELSVGKITKKYVQAQKKNKDVDKSIIIDSIDNDNDAKDFDEDAIVVDLNETESDNSEEATVENENESGVDADVINEDETDEYYEYESSNSLEEESGVMNDDKDLEKSEDKYKEETTTKSDKDIFGEKPDDDSRKGVKEKKNNKKSKFTDELSDF